MIRTETAGICLLAILLVASCHAQDDQCPSMPANPDFEKGTNSWCLPKALWRVADGEGRNGSKALVWENSDPKRYLFPRHKIALKPGGIYRYGAWVKVDELKKVKPHVSLDFANAEGKWIGADYARATDKKDSDGWVYYEGVTQPLSSDTVSGNLFGFLPRNATGRVRFDDFSFAHEGMRLVDVVVSSAYRDTAESGPVKFVATLFLDPAEVSSGMLAPSFVFRGVDGVDVETPPDEFDVPASPRRDPASITTWHGDAT